MKTISRIFSGALLVALIAAIMLFGAPRLFGVKLFNVTSGSMKPAYKVGDLIYAVPAEKDEIKVGDTISFMLNQTTVATHRVIEADPDNGQFGTKGDANEHADGSPVQYENIIGVVRFSVPYAGSVLSYIGQGTGRVITIAGFIAFILLTLIMNINSGSGVEKQKKKGNPPPGWGSGKANEGISVRNQRWNISGNIRKGLVGLCILCVAGTVAYLTTTTTTEINTFAVGTAKVEVEEPNVTDPKEVPWGIDTKQVQLKNPTGEGMVPGVVRALIVPELLKEGDVVSGDLADLSEPVSNQMILGDFTLHFAADWAANWFFKDGYFYYRTVLDPGETTSLLLTGVTLTDQEKAEEYEDIDVQIHVFSDILQSEGDGAGIEWGITISDKTVLP